MSWVPSLTIDVNADHSCNWKCCFNPAEQIESGTIVPPNTPDIGSPIQLGKRQISSGSDGSTTEKVRVVQIEVHRHRHKKAITDQHI
jgi:hypothetical protein